jgi:predicted membrane GTPase involved in stress response
VTPQSLRIRKAVLDTHARNKQKRQEPQSAA